MSTLADLYTCSQCKKLKWEVCKCGRCRTCCGGDCVVVVCEKCGESFPNTQMTFVDLIGRGTLLMPTPSAVCPICLRCLFCCSCTRCERCGKLLANSGRCPKCGQSYRCGCCRCYATDTLEGHLALIYSLSNIEGLAKTLEKNPKAREAKKMAEEEARELVRLTSGALDEIAKVVAAQLFDYSVACCLAEMGHLCRLSRHEIGIKGSCRAEKGRSEVIGTAANYEPYELVEICSEAFYDPRFYEASNELSEVQSGSPSGFGGHSWATIAAGALRYQKVSTMDFLDHMVDLVHNNGTFVGKTGKFFSIVSRERYMALLELKKHNGLADVGVRVAATPAALKAFEYAFALKVVEPFIVELTEVPNYTPVQYKNKPVVILSNKKDPWEGVEELREAWRELRGCAKKKKSKRLGELKWYKALAIGKGSPPRASIIGCICNLCAEATNDQIGVVTK